MRSLLRRLRISLHSTRVLFMVLFGLLLAAPAFAQANSPWENAVNVLQQAFTSTIARGLSLVAIVVSGLTFAFAPLKVVSPIVSMWWFRLSADPDAAWLPKLSRFTATNLIPISSSARLSMKERTRVMPDSLTNSQESVTPVQYVRWLFDPSDKLALLVRSRERGETTQRITTGARAAEDFFQNWLRLMNQRHSSDVYIGMNPLKPEAHARTKENVRAICHLYLDLDHDSERSLAAVEQSNLVPSPNVVLQTSPDKLQLVWRVDGFTQDNAEAMLRTLARKFGGDPAATDSTRVLRIPGFRNHKYDFDFTVTARIISDHRFTARDFRLKTEPTDLEYNPSYIKKPDSSSSTRQALSQSEHDWAYAKRSLAKGVPAEELIRQIAAFRAGDKHDPEDYARRTVSKAEAQLRAVKISNSGEGLRDLPPDRS